MAAGAVVFFCAVYLLVLFGWAGVGALPIVGVMVASIYLAVVVPAAAGWPMRRSSRHRNEEGYT
jgi:hypothetical protein